MGNPAKAGGKARGLALIESLGIPAPWWVVAAGPVIGEPGIRYIARSSAESEDSTVSSQAGVFQSVVFDGGNAEAAGRAFDAARESGAVVVQRFVEAQISGVIFSADPGGASFDHYYCEAVLGDAARLVDGSARPSGFRIGVGDGLVLSSIRGEDGPEALDAESAAVLGRWVRLLEEATGLPQDIEWVHDGAQLWCVQARPLTALALDLGYLPAICATSWFFDQRFQRPVTPMTRTTLVPQIIRAAIHHPLRMVGCHDLPDPIYYAGQIYVPHRAYRKMFGGMPRWLLTRDLQQLFPDQCSCGPESSSLLRALPAFLREWRVSIRTIRAWDAFRDGLEARLGGATWDSLCALTDEFLAIHRWSLFWADVGYALGGTRRDLATPTREANRLRGHLPDAEFLDLFGHRSGSLDFAEPTWAEEAGYVARPGAWVPSRGHGLRRLLAMREEQRFEWERILALQRRMLLETGESLALAGRIGKSSDVFWLEWEELKLAVDFHDRVARRKHEAAVGSVARKPLFIGPREVAVAGIGQGMGVSGGRARGVVFVHRGPLAPGVAIPPGCILVLRSMDPAWTWILPTVAGIILERGGLLSHAAIMAREYGVPAVTNVQDATTLLQNGLDVLIDGETGIVTLHPAQAGVAPGVGSGN